MIHRTLVLFFSDCVSGFPEIPISSVAEVNCPRGCNPIVEKAQGGGFSGLIVLGKTKCPTGKDDNILHRVAQERGPSAFLDTSANCLRRSRVGEEIVESEFWAQAEHRE